MDAQSPVPQDLPAPDQATGVQLKIPMPLTGCGSETWWREEIRQSEKRAKKEHQLWKTNLGRYKGQKPKLPGLVPTDTITVNADFYNTEQKKAQLFYQNPDIQLAPRRPENAESAALLQQIVNYRLGPNGVDASSLMDEVLFDEIVTSGFGVTVIGYEAQTVQVALPSGQIDPATGQPAVGPDGQPAMAAPLTQTVWSRYFWERISPTKALVPSQWTSVDFDRAPWLGYKFDQDTEQTETRFKVSRGDLAEGPVDNTLLGENDKEFLTDQNTGYVIWYRASYIDPTVKNPDLFRRLILVGTRRGQATAVVHEDSTYQRTDPQGRLIAGMEGNPIHFFTLRAIGDTAYPPSDCSISRSATDELSISRSQMIVQRKRNLPMRGADKNRVDKNDMDRLERGEIQGVVMIDGDPNAAIKVIANAAMPVENFQFNEIITNDIRSMWALGANSQTLQQAGGKTATEAAIIAKATDTRLTKERNRHLNQYCKGVEKLSSLFQLFDDDTQYAPIVGPDGATTLVQWNKQQIAGRFLFIIKPDSSVRMDASEDLQEKIQAYNLLGRDPHFNRLPMLKMLAERLGLDPATMVIDQLPPQPPPPDLPKVSLALKAEDLDNPAVVQILKQCGLDVTLPQPVADMADMLGVHVAHQPVTPQIMPPQTAHPGAVEKPQPIDKHEASRANDRPGPKVMVQ